MKSKSNHAVRAMRWLVTLFALQALAGTAQATDGTWTNNASGNWSDGFNWLDGIVADGADSTAFFTNNITADRIVTNDGTRTIGNITFTDNDRNLTIASNTLADTLTFDVTAGMPIVNVTQSGRTLTISSQISGTDGLQKDGLGILTLTGANDYTGGTVINAGRLSVGADANLGNATGSITFNGGELYLNTGSPDIMSARDVILNNVSGNQILLQGNQDWNNSGALTGDGGVTFAQSRNGNVSATLTSMANTFKGALRFKPDNGTVTVRMRSLADSATANGNIIFGNSTSSQVFEWDSAGGADNHLTLAYRNFEFAGDGNAQGTIRKTSTTQALNISSGISATGTGSKTLVLDINGNANNEISGVISDGAGTVGINKTTSGGVLVLTGNNSYSGGTTIGNGTLSVNTLADFGQNSPIGAATSGAVTIGGTTASGTLLYTGGAQSTDRTIKISGWDQANGGGATIRNDGTGKLTFTAPTFNESYTANNATTRPLTLRGSNDGEIQGTIQDGGSNLNILGDGLPFLKTSLTKNDAGTWVLSGTNTYSGVTTISGGMLQFAREVSLYNNTSASWTKANIIVNSGATLGLNVGGAGEFTTSDITTLLGNLTVGINNNGLRSGSKLAFDTSNASGGSFTVADDIANSTGTGGGALGLTKLGTNTLALTGNSTYSGATTISNGTLVVNGTLSSGGGTVTVNSDGTLAGTGTINRPVTVTSGGTLKPGDPAGTLTITGNVVVNAGATNEFALGTSSALVAVTGNLTLAGSVTVTDAGGLTETAYTLFTYTGSLDTNGVSVNNPLPGGRLGEIDTTSNPGQVDLVVSTGGGLPPTAGFTAAPLSGVEPLQVVFTDTSTGLPTSWFWDFNNDATVDSMEPSPTNTFGAGTWTVSLVASNANGASSPYTTNITVLTVQQSWEAHYGVLANGTDTDGDGVSNLDEFKAGFNPTNNAAYPRILSLTRTGNDLTIVYQASNGDTNYAGAAASRTNVMDYSTGTANGGYDGSFSGLATNVLSGGNGSGIVTNAVELNGATNSPARYYRVRVQAP